MSGGCVPIVGGVAGGGFPLYRPGSFTEYFNDFDVANEVAEGWNEILVAGGNSFPNNLSVDSNHPGVLQIQVTTAVGAAVTYRKWNTSWTFGNGLATYETLVLLDNLFDAGDPGDFRIGFGDANAAVGNNAIWFIQSDASAFWQTQTVAAGATAGAVATTVALATATWFKLKFVVAADASLVSFFIDNVLVGTSAVNIPAGANLTGPNYNMVRGPGGTGTRVAHVDYVHYWKALTR